MSQPSTNSPDTILNSIKTLLGLQIEETHFDAEILMITNSVIDSLSIVGIGPEEGFTVEGSSEWSSYIDDEIMTGSVRNLIYMKVRMVFDPPTNSFLVESYNSQIEKLEYLNALRWLTLLKKSEEAKG